MGNYIYSKRHKNDKVYWITHKGYTGELLISFGKGRKYNLWEDYPWNLTKEEKEIFDKENPYWANYFRNRCLEKQTDNLDYKFIKFTFVSDLEESYINDVQKKYGITFPQILKEYYKKYNESVLYNCIINVEGKQISINKIISLKYGNHCLEKVIEHQKNERIPSKYVPFARNVENEHFYWDTTDGHIYVDANSHCDIKEPIKICDSIDELFKLMEDSITDQEE